MLRASRNIWSWWMHSAMGLVHTPHPRGFLWNHCSFCSMDQENLSKTIELRSNGPPDGREDITTPPSLGFSSCFCIITWGTGLWWEVGAAWARTRVSMALVTLAMLSLIIPGQRVHWVLAWSHHSLSSEDPGDKTGWHGQVRGRWEWLVNHRFGNLRAGATWEVWEQEEDRPWGLVIMHVQELRLGPLIGMWHEDRSGARQRDREQRRAGAGPGGSRMQAFPTPVVQGAYCGTDPRMWECWPRSMEVLVSSPKSTFPPGCAPSSATPWASGGLSRDSCTGGTWVECPELDLQGHLVCVGVPALRGDPQHHKKKKVQSVEQMAFEGRMDLKNNHYSISTMLLIYHFYEHSLM